MAYENCDFLQAKEKVSIKRNNAWKNNRDWSQIMGNTNIKKIRKETGGTDTENEASTKNKDERKDNVKSVEKDIREIIKEDKGKTMELKNVPIFEKYQENQINNEKEKETSKLNKNKERQEELKFLDFDFKKQNKKDIIENNKENNPVKSKKEEQDVNLIFPNIKEPLKESNN